MHLVLRLFFAILVSTSVITCQYCPDYYWRDYHGVVPQDAVPAGKSRDGSPIHIGQVYIRNFELLPATIVANQTHAKTSAYGRPMTTTKNIKILCSPLESPFEWVATTSQHLNSLKKKYHLVPGGSEVGENLYIGRIHDDGAVVLGKIFRNEVNNKGLWYPAGKTEVNALTYEVLTYDCKKAYPQIDARAGFT